MKVATVQRDAKRPKRLEQSTFEVDRDDVASAKDRSVVQCSCPASVCLRTRQLSERLFVMRAWIIGNDDPLEQIA